MSDETPIDARPNTAADTGRPSLREALRRARIESAERSDVVIDLKHAEIARLEILRDALAPVFADVPAEIDLFDVGLVPGDRPRLFVDMVSFVEMGRDRKLYRFLRDGRHGRAVAAESEKVEPIVAAVTDYVARRLIERERLLAHDDRGSENVTAAAPADRSVAPASPAMSPAATPETAVAPAFVPVRRSSRLIRTLAVLGAVAVGGACGVAVVVALMVAAAKGVLPGVG